MSSDVVPQRSSGIRDNLTRGTVAEFLKEKIRHAYQQRLEIRRQRRVKTLKARARRLLLQAAMVEIALGQQQDIFSKESYPTSFNEMAVTGLGRHGKVWKWVLKIGYEPGLRPDKGDPFYVKAEGQAAEKLRGLFGSLSKEAMDVVREWLRIGQRPQRTESGI